MTGASPVGNGGPVTGTGTAPGIADDAPASASPLPAPALPRGGGAVHGLGETVTVEPRTGGCSVRIPLALSRGRGASDVALALVHSGGGRSPYGLGWNVSIPRIARSGRYGVPSYTDADTFELDGEELVPVPGADAPVQVDGNAARVRRFRPRADDDGTRVERVTITATRETFWRTVSRENVAMRFGRTPASRVADPARPDTRVAEWLLDEVRDDRGNVAAYEYKPEDTKGVAPAAHEAARLAPGAPAQAGRYLKRVRYANAGPGDPASARLLVVLDYGEHDEADAEARDWPARIDPYSSHRNGFEVRTWRLCRRFLVFHDFPELDGPSPRLVRSIDLAYDEDPVATTLRAVEQVGYDWAGGAYVSLALPPVEVAYYDGAPETTVRTADISAVPAGARIHWVDLDGDGLPGVLATDEGAWWYQRPAGDGTYEPPRAVELPASGRLPGAPDVSDVDGSGRVMAVSERPELAGSSVRDADGSWRAWRPFVHRPVTDTEAAERYDVDADGRTDVVRLGPDELTWHRGLGRDGFGPGQRVRHEGPPVPSADDGRAWFRADMTGDGTSDVVRVRNGSVVYWPNAGRGRFGAPVTMGGAPLLDHPDTYDPARVRLADLDGSGCAGLVYVGRGAVVTWANQAGNWWGPARVVAPFPAVGDLDEVDVVDLLGKGSPCLVWTTPEPRHGRVARYLDLSAGYGRRGDVRTVTTNLGRRYDVEYASSAAYALADRRAGEPWRTRLASSVSVVARTVEHDDVAETTHVTRYAYRDGWFDPAEREFRGFARVDVADADVAAVVTRHWFHLGGPDAEPYGAFAGDPLAQPLPPHELAGVTTGREHRQAVGALAGLPLRTEVYGDDGGSPDPYTVTAHRHRVALLQSATEDRPAVFRTEPLETVEWHYERDAADPRVTHDLTLETDARGTVLSAVRAAYPRRAPAIPEQAAPLVTWSVTEVAHTDDATTLRLGVAVATREYEVTGVPVPPAGRYDLAALRATLPALPAAQRTPISAETYEYWNDALTAALPAGQTGRRALLRRTRRLAFPDDLLATVYGATAGAATLAEGGYEHDAGGWWFDDGVTRYDAAALYQPTAWEWFGNTATVTYDAHRLLAVATKASTTAPLDRNAVAVRNDYRVLAPAALTDPHGIESSVAFDPLGRVVAGWLRGPGGTGDAPALPGVVCAYGSTAWRDGDGPAWSQTDTRERHGDAASRWQRQRLYVDGLGRVVMTKSQAEPGLASAPDGAGGAVLVDTTPAVRWIGTGRTVFDAKGMPVEAYEAYFSATVAYESADALVKQRIEQRRAYDPLGRLVRADHGDGTVERVVVGAWSETAYDRNDTVLTTQWHADRQQAGTQAADARAATLAAAHANTPLVSLTDPLGRVVRTRADNGPGGVYETVHRHDAGGRPVAVDDALGRATVRQVHDLAGRAVATESIDAGRQVVLPAADGQPIRQWGANGDRIRVGYDALRRRTHLWVRDAGAPGERLAELTVHGEIHPQAAARFLVGRVHRRYDEAGVSRVDRHDLAGNVSEGGRQVLRGTAMPDWSALDGVAFGGLDAAAAALLDPETFAAASAFDAAGRPVRQQLPDGTTVEYAYNAGGLVERVRYDTTDVVTTIEYDARRRRTRIDYGNGVTTRYSYDAASLRLRDVVSSGPAGTLQDLTYTYDAIGNVVKVDDHAQQAVFFAGAVVNPASLYEYDALYRLRSATGREHASLGAQPDRAEPATRPVPHPNDAGALRTYTQTYDYDDTGNLLTVAHAAGAGSWTRPYDYVPGTNRLRAHGLPGDPAGGPFTATFDHDAAGNMTRMPHLAALGWDHSGALRHVDLGGGGTVTYQHDGKGHRVRKVWQRNGGLREERIYLGDHEVYRRHLNGALVFERRTAHVREGGRRVALVERVTVDTANPAPAASPVVRYELADHLGSSVAECDETGAVIAYEEYHPYGSTAIWLARGAAAVSTRRYRYTGKEKDDETGLYFYGARYYAPWLGRWTSPDPAGLTDGANRYAYVNGNPIRLNDPDGLSGEDPQLWLSESGLIGLPRKATATDRGFTPKFREDMKKFIEHWGGGPKNYQLGHPKDDPFAIQPPGKESLIRPERTDINASKGATSDKARAGQARAAGQKVRDPDTGLYPGAKKGARVGQPKYSVPTNKPPPPKTFYLTPPPVKGPAVKPMEQLSLPFGKEKQLSLPLGKPPAPSTPPPPPAVPPAVPPAPVTPAAPVTPPAGGAAPAAVPKAAPAAPAPPPVAAEAPVATAASKAGAPKPGAAPKAVLTKAAPAADDAALAAKTEAGAAKAMKTGGDVITSVKPVAQEGTVVKAGGALTKVVATGSKVVKTMAPVLKAAKPVLKVVAPVAKVVGKIAKPLAVGVASVELVTASNNTDRLVASGDLAAGVAAYCGPVGVAFSVGYTVGGLADQGIGMATKATIGVDLSPSNLMAHQATATDQLISKVIPDSPDKPAYKNENKVAWFLIDTLGF